MTLDLAMQSPVATLTGADIWRAICLIGVRKLAMRRATPYLRILDELRPYNVRLDVLQAEDERRRFLPKEKNVSHDKQLRRERPADPGLRSHVG